MRTITILRFLACALLLVSASLISQASFADAVTGTIRGTITVAGNPTNGILVRLYVQGLNVPVDAADTDAQGVYEFTDVALGKYIIKIGLASYQDEIHDVMVCPKVISTADFKPATIFGNIKGTIVGVNSASGPATVVRLIDGQKRTVAVANADSVGRYGFSNVLADSYFVEFQHPGYPVQEVGIAVMEGKTFSFAYHLSNTWRSVHSSDGYVHLRHPDLRNDLLSLPHSETTYPDFGTPLRIR